MPQVAGPLSTRLRQFRNVSQFGPELARNPITARETNVLFDLALLRDSLSLLLSLQLLALQQMRRHGFSILQSSRFHNL